jgi:hypothetical protein
MTECFFASLLSSSNPTQQINQPKNKKIKNKIKKEEEEEGKGEDDKLIDFKCVRYRGRE